MWNTRVIAAGLAVAAGLLSLDGSDAVAGENRKVRIINETGYTIVRFYGSNAGTDSWEEDILGDKTLKPGDSIMIDFDDGTGYCLFDFKAEFDDGDDLIREDVDVCKISSYRYHE